MDDSCPMANEVYLLPTQISNGMLIWVVSFFQYYFIVFFFEKNIILCSASNSNKYSESGWTKVWLYIFVIVAVFEIYLTQMEVVH